MRLDLLRFNCINFSLSAEVRTARDHVERIQDVMSQTVCHRLAVDEEGETLVLGASFGSVSKLRNGTYRIRSRLVDSLDENEHVVSLEVEYEIAPDGLSPPPRGMRPVSVLIDNSSDVFGVISVTCHAFFEYNQSGGFLSSINFPLPLMLQDEARGITHIESAQFSLRSGDNVLHTVIVTTNSETGSVGHMVEFEKEVQLNRAAIRALFNEAVAISTRLVRRTEDG